MCYVLLPIDALSKGETSAAEEQSGVSDPQEVACVTFLVGAWLVAMVFMAT